MTKICLVCKKYSYICLYNSFGIK